MKKLMIAAAAAALVGGAFAADTAYTFTASVKTTVGKAGKTTSTYNLGKSIDGKFWYEDATVYTAAVEDDPDTDPDESADASGLIVDYPDYFATKTINGSTIPCLSAKAKADYNWLADNIVPLATTYAYKSANKWCETFKVVLTGCYRVAGTKKFSAIVKGDACCEALTALDDEDTAVAVDFSGFTQRFGGLTYQTAKKVEVLGTITADDSDRVDGKGRTISGDLAGQGSVGKVLVVEGEDIDTEDLGVTSISGYLVGELNAPVCVNCCDANTPAVAFTCGDERPYDNLTTAGYGTFSLKYNAKATKALAD